MGIWSRSVLVLFISSAIVFCTQSATAKSEDVWIMVALSVIAILSAMVFIVLGTQEENA